jgi:HK97 family phage major capsid protein
MKNTIHAVSTGPLEGDPRRGFPTLGHFAASVRAASIGRSVDPRLETQAAAPTTFGSESVGQDGGFVVPPLFSQRIWRLCATEENLLTYSDNIEIDGNSMVLPIDPQTAWASGSGSAYWAAEGTLGTQTKPKLATNTLRLNKLLALVPLTQELLDDASGLSSYLEAACADRMRFAINEAILNGPGGGKPTGVFKSGAGVVVAKDSGQATQTISATNLSNMVSRLTQGSFQSSVWLAAPDALPSLLTAVPPGYPMTVAAPGADGKPSPLVGLLFGRPVIASQHVAEFSAQGDVSLVDLKFYQSITRAGDPTAMTSIHLWFDQYIAAFRVSFRVDGVSKIEQPIIQAIGGKTLSPFLQLQAR